jgi:hypothetical protein
MYAAADLYADVLDALTAARAFMLSTQFQAALTDATRPAAGETLYNVQEAILDLSNASLANIADNMEANEISLRQQTDGLNAVIKTFNNVQSVIDGITRIIGTVGKILPLL